jgi:hypothetical protein
MCIQWIIMFINDIWGTHYKRTKRSSTWTDRLVLIEDVWEVNVRWAGNNLDINIQK